MDRPTLDETTLRKLAEEKGLAPPAPEPVPGEQEQQPLRIDVGHNQDRVVVVFSRPVQHFSMSRPHARTLAEQIREASYAADGERGTRLAQKRREKKKGRRR